MKTTVALAVFLIFAVSTSGQTAQTTPPSSEALAQLPITQEVIVQAQQIVPQPQHPRAKIVPIPTWPANKPAPIIPIPTRIEPQAMAPVSSGVIVIGAPIPWESVMQVPEKIPANQLPFSPVDRQIDALGTASNIHSPADAEAYINAILDKYKIDPATIPGLSPLAHRLAVAEYAAITSDPSKRIPEARIAEAFNRLMDEWGEPKWTRITVEDFHRFHKIKAVTLIPYSVSRDAEKNVAYSYRPVEAVYLFGVLSIDRGLQSNYKTLPDLPSAKGPVHVDTTKTRLQPVNNPTKEWVAMNRNYTEYLQIRSAWLQGHPDPAQEIGRLFDALHIE